MLERENINILELSVIYSMKLQLWISITPTHTRKSSFQLYDTHLGSFVPKFSPRIFTKLLNSHPLSCSLAYLTFDCRVSAISSALTDLRPIRTS